MARMTFLVYTCAHCRVKVREVRALAMRPPVRCVECGSLVDSTALRYYRTSQLNLWGYVWHPAPPYEGESND